MREVIISKTAEKKLDKSIEIIRQSPKSFPESEKKAGLHKCVITKQKIIIVTVFNDRLNPLKLKKEI